MTVIRRLTTLAINRPRRVLVGAGVLFVIAAVLGVPVTGTLGSSSQDFQDPGLAVRTHERRDHGRDGAEPVLHLDPPILSGAERRMTS